jgi:hypothetical protein
VRAKIYYNINESDYTLTTETMVFYFSSKLYLDKFIEKYEHNRKTIQYMLSSRFNIEFTANEYFDVILYTQIEKRGFRIVKLVGGEVFKCLKDMILNGEIKMLRNCSEL